MRSANRTPKGSTLFRKPSSRRVRLAAGVAIGFASMMAPALAEAADKILIIQWPSGDLLADAASNAAKNHMVSLGYDVTLIDNNGSQVPANVSDYSEVYLISTGLTPDTDAANLVTYVQGGGHLYVTGERPDPANDPQGLVVQEKILKPLLKNSSGLQVGTGVEAGNPPGIGKDVLNFVTEKTNVALHPNTLTTMYMIDPGVIGGVPDANIFLKDQSAAAHPVGAVWTHDDLVQGSGCVMLMMDINWWDAALEVSQPPPTSTQVEMVVANVHDFMKYCGDHDLDGILDGDEPALGTDPANPDSDGDGLCDGGVAVDDPSIPQKCIAGENATTHQDTDGDGIIDALDPDDDNDGIPTATEVQDVAMFGNPDSDNVPAWLDTDSDGDGVSDMAEGRKHFNSMGVPDYLDPNYPTPMPTSSSTTTAGSGGGAGVTVGGGATSATGSGSGGGDSGGDSGGCGCVVADEGETTQDIGLVGMFAGLATLFGRSASRRRRANRQTANR